MFKFFLSILLLLVSSFSFAHCTTVKDFSDSTTLPDMVVMREAPVGSVIQTVYTPSSIAWATGCSGGEILGYTIVYSNTISNLGQHIYQTSVPGIGIRVVNRSDVNMSFDSPRSIYPYDGSNIGWYGAKVDLIVTGKVSSGVLNAGELATMGVTLNDGTFQVGYTMNISSAKVTSLACSITSGSSLTFPIGDVPAAQFIAAGSHSQQTSTVNIGLNCDPDVNINITLNGTQNPDSSDDSVLALSGQGESGVADGIGVQLLYNNTPLKLNNMLNLKKSAGGQETFPITARYYQAKDLVKPGDANATATLSLTYQ